MRIKKAGDKVYGADFTAAERKAMNLEIQRQLAEYSRKHANEIDAIILWQLHAQYGFGEKRLRRFYDRFKAEYFDLIKRYEMDEGDNIWLNTYKLKESASTSNLGIGTVRLNENRQRQLLSEYRKSRRGPFYLPSQAVWGRDCRR